MITIALVDDTGNFSPTDMDQLAHVCSQYAFEVEALYGAHVAAHVVTGKTVPRDAWRIHLMHDSDQADALAYHEIDTNGNPSSRVFVDTLKQAGASMTVGLTHELGEMIVDPGCCDCTQVTDTRFVAREICDPVEADQFAWDIGGVKVSDFVTPRWFQKGLRPGLPVSYNGGVKRPLLLAPGGYAIVFDTRAGGWRQVQAMTGDGTSDTGTSLRAETAHRVKLRTLMSDLAVYIGNDLEGIHTADLAVA